MTPRLFANLVYAWLCARVAFSDDPKARQRLDDELYAPLEGLAAMQENFLANLAAAAAGGDG